MIRNDNNAYNYRKRVRVGYEQYTCKPKVMKKKRNEAAADKSMRVQPEQVYEDDLLEIALVRSSNPWTLLPSRSPSTFLSQT